MEPCIVIHGGCRTIPDEYQESVRQGVKLAARKGYEVLLEVKWETFILKNKFQADLVLKDEPVVRAQQEIVFLNWERKKRQSVF